MSEWKPTSIHDAFGIKRQTSGRDYFWRIFAICALIALCIVGYLNSRENRYRPFADDYLILDTWTGKVYDTDSRVVNQQK